MAEKSADQQERMHVSNLEPIPKPAESPVGFFAKIFRPLIKMVCDAKAPEVSEAEKTKQAHIMGGYLRLGGFEQGFHILEKYGLTPDSADVLEGFRCLSAFTTDTSKLDVRNIKFAVQFLRRFHLSIDQKIEQSLKSQLISYGKFESIEYLCNEEGMPIVPDDYSKCGDVFLNGVHGEHCNNGVYRSEKVDKRVRSENERVENIYVLAIICYVKAKDAAKLKRCLDQALQGGWESIANMAALALSRLKNGAV